MPGRLRKLSSSVFPLRGQREDAAAGETSTDPACPDLADQPSNSNIHVRQDECLRTEDVCYAREWYIECWRSSRKKELPPWECRIETFFPRASSWRSRDPLPEIVESLHPADAADRCEDTHWAFGPEGLRLAAERERERELELERERDAQQASLATTEDCPPEPQADPAPKHEDQHAPDASGKSPAAAAAPPPAAVAAPAPPSAPPSASAAAAAAPRARRQRSATAKQLAAGERNRIRDDEIHTNHIDDPVGCACDHCLAAAGLESVGPLQVLDLRGAVVDVERLAFCASPIGIDSDGQGSHKGRGSAASSVKSDSPRKHGLGGLIEGLKRSSTSTSGSLGRMRDSGYASSTRMDSH